MRSVLICVLLGLCLQGCNQNTRNPGTRQASPDTAAQQLLASGDYFAAAGEYTRLAKLYPEQAVYFQLRTADSLLRAGDTAQATEILKRTQASPGRDTFYKGILQAKLALNQGLAQQALDQLAQQPPAESSQLLADWHETRAEAFALSLNFIKAAESRIKLDPLLVDPQKRLSNIRSTWEDLNRIKLPILRELRNSGFGPMQAWVELCLINKTMLFKGTLLEQALNTWIEQYPGHPASPTITAEILSLSQQAALQPQHLAVLLPLSGQFEKAAHAIRDGFLAAWYAEKGRRPRISIYDSNSLDIESVYQQAQSNGADFIVGPLEKQAIEALLQGQVLDVTTLALNHADHTTREQVYRAGATIPRIIQFGLAPESEARQAAEKAFSAGHRKALIISPNNDWGARLATAFAETWNRLGGKVLEYVNYDSRMRDYATPVKKLLNIDSSELRAAQLRQKLNRAIQGEPRLREDADMIFMAAVPLSARQIVPQFRFYRADDVPVYSSSHVYSGVVNSQADSDMNGVLFVDMPALLSPEKISSGIHVDLNRNWSADTSSFRRLYALGIDAYRMIPHLGKLALVESAVYNGETGELYMDNEGRIQRRLMWARFVNGMPRILAE